MDENFRGNVSLPIKVGLVGCGKWGSVLKEKLSNLGISIAWCGGRDLLPLQSRLRDSTIPAVDWIIIATPATTHFSLALEALEAGKNVFIEKPATISLADTERLFSKAKQKDLKIFVDTIFVRRAEYLTVKQYLGSCAPKLIRFSWSKPDLNSEAVMDRLVYHDLYMLVDLIGTGLPTHSVRVLARHSGYWNFTCVYGDTTVYFEYTLSKSTVMRKTLEVIPTSNESNSKTVEFKSLQPSEQDPLQEVLSEVLQHRANYEQNHEIILAAESIREILQPLVEPRINVIGGGIFGSTCAWMLAKAGAAVRLYEAKSDLMQCASEVNQRRLHRGYHYPRSDETGVMSRDGQRRFLDAYKVALLDHPTAHYYAIAKEGSLTSREEMISFCERLELSFEEVAHPLIYDEMVSLVIKVEEELWDHDKLRAECWRLLNLHGVSINLNSKVGLMPDEASLPPANHTIVACYASNNVVLKGVLGVEFTSQDLQFELCEKPVFRLPQQFWGKSCVIMDGPFMCIDPISDADPSLFVMGNVEHAIHSSNIGEKPETLSELKLFLNQGVVPSRNIPRGLSRADTMLKSASQFFKNLEHAEHVGSMFTHRTVLPKHEHDDARPSLIEHHSHNVTSIFSGKVVSCVDIGHRLCEELLCPLNP